MLARAMTMLGVLAMLVSCMGKDPYNPGTPLGTFSVSGVLAGSTCGDAPNPWDFDVKLSQDHDTLYWVQGDVPVSGILADDAVNMTATASQIVYQANPQTGLGSCTLTRSDTLRLTVSGSPIDAFTGTLSYTFAPTSDSDCSQAVGTDAYATLPCTVTYGMGATRTALPSSTGY